MENIVFYPSGAEHFLPLLNKTDVLTVLPCLPGSTMYKISHRINGEAYVSKVLDVSFEIFKDMFHIRDCDGASYIYGVNIFRTEQEAVNAANKENKERETF